jgi:hypothetical protein
MLIAGPLPLLLFNVDDDLLTIDTMERASALRRKNLE